MERIDYVLATNGHGRNTPKDKDPVLTYTEPIVLTDKGKYTVFYRAVDQAGRISLWKKVTVDVDKVKGQALINEIEGALGAGQNETVMSAAVGEKLFKAPGPADPNNKIKALPDYLTGAMLIQGTYADKYVYGRDIVSFTTLADVDVYVMKNQASRADFSGWELVEKAFSVEPVVYYKGGADVYHKFFPRGSRVSIPGAGVWGVGYGNLVFVKEAVSNQVRITSPEAGSVLASGDQILLASYTEIPGVAGYVWETKLGDGEWQTVSTKPLDNYLLPETEGVTPFSLRLTVTDSKGKTVTVTASYEITSRAHVRLINPAPGEELLTNEEVRLDYRVYDAQGRELPRRSVSFSVREGEDGAWRPFPLHGQTLRAPRYECALYLKASIKLRKGKEQEEIFQFTVVKRPKPFWIHFWPRPGFPWCRGSRRGYQPGGRHYGFTKDLGRSWERFWVKDDKGKVSARGCVTLDGREAFTYQSGQGTFKVNLTVLVEKNQTTYLLVNNKPVKLDNSKNEARLWNVELTTEADFGAFKVSGSKGLGLVDISVERVKKGGKDSPKTIASPVKGLRVLGKY